MLLTFEKGRFVLTFGSKDSVGLNPDDENWTFHNPRLYSTALPKAAARFKACADDGARKVIDRVFVKSIPLPSRPLPPYLDPHQIKGIKWLLSRPRSYLAHAPGAGKTCQAITAAALIPGKEQTIFIVPPELTANWVREIDRWTNHPDYPVTDWPSVSVIPESRHQETAGFKADFVIVPDSMLTRDWVQKKLTSITKKKLVAVDEASRFKEPKAQRTIALFGGQLKSGLKTPGIIKGARHAVLLDGSPMPNRPMELWAPTIAMAPEAIDFMNQEDFGFRYCGARFNDYGWEYKHSSNEDELRERLQKHFMHVVTEDELDHPERLRSILFMTKDVRSLEQKTWEKKHLTSIHFDDINEEMSDGELAEFRHELGMRKVPWVANYVASRLKEKNESILLFAWHRDVCQALMDRLKKYKPALVIGGTASDERERHFAEFQAGERKLIIGNISAMGRGHNLQRADRAVFAEFSWNDETNKQCEKRAARKGRDKKLSVRCDYIICPDSFDEPQLNAVFQKATRVKRIIG